ncbi:unnamed protein product [Bemisia tabaci]|uniref:G-protein coupled receptors family 1 profile domain-containing protein n=1 Tax=Bemisia tabaci TaxID=7038 RepID=A0A9P0A6S6_BEMTA|nr:unnamed protein product [Bemisia tabaci]
MVAVAVVVAFFICWAPFHAQRLFATYVFTGESSSRYSHLAYAVLTYVSGVFYYISTTINPILYHIMSNKFREAFKELCANEFNHAKGTMYRAKPMHNDRSVHTHT